MVLDAVARLPAGRSEGENRPGGVEPARRFRVGFARRTTAGVDCEQENNRPDEYRRRQPGCLPQRSHLAPSIMRLRRRAHRVDARAVGRPRTEHFIEGRTSDFLDTLGSLRRLSADPHLSSGYRRTSPVKSGGIWGDDVIRPSHWGIPERRGTGLRWAHLLGSGRCHLRRASESGNHGEPLADCLRVEVGRLDGKQVANVIDGPGCPARPSGVLRERRGVDNVIVPSLQHKDGHLHGIECLVRRSLRDEHGLDDRRERGSRAREPFRVLAGRLEGIEPQVDLRS